MNIYTFLQTQIKNRIPQKRLCFVWFGDEGISLKTAHVKGDGRLYIKKSLYLPDVHELSFDTVKRIKMFFFTVFFPFPFECVIFLPFPYIQSQITVLPFTPTQKNEQEDVSSFVSQYVWPSIEKQKKSFVETKGCNELEALLVQSHVIAASQGGKNLPLTRETIQVPTHISFLHTFLFRPVFSKISRILPKRGSIGGFMQQGLLSAYDISLKEKEPFLYIRIGARMTDVYRSDAHGIMHLDGIHMGYKNLYDVLHAHLDINIDTFHTILERLGKKELSLKSQRHIEQILKKEVEEFDLGIKNFQKTTKIKKVYIDPGPLDIYFSSKRAFRTSLLSYHKPLWKGRAEMYQDEFLREAHIQRHIHYTNSISTLMLKFLRWLLPHSLKF